MFLAGSEFDQLGPDARAALQAAAIRRRYGHNAFIYIQEEEAEHLYVVRSGHVRLSYLMEDGSAVLYAILPAGESFGELGIFDGGVHCDMATAIGDTVVAAIPIGGFHHLAARHGEIGRALSRVVARRYRSYIDLTRILSLRSLPARLAQSLLRLADGLGTTAEHGGRRVPCVGSVVTQTDLGLMARGARGNVNRALKMWERAGWIALRDRSIILLDRPRLEALAIEDEDA
ncbi:Crp/Fnr family transcriptional regulator [Prosthecomicrobium sp. N25]|uniref:Crp/Fnr family transcriptional regulator n=1 Tax=Prosthecomicrobium sp. N25 TaxID=3129254 RepID=UPI0030784EBB